MRPKHTTLTPQELENHETRCGGAKAPLSAIFTKRCSNNRKIAYTTVMTMMKILEKPRAT